jgi:hypothetical protein
MFKRNFILQNKRILLLTTVAITTNMNAILKASDLELRCKNLRIDTQRMWSIKFYNTRVYWREGGVLGVTNEYSKLTAG